MMQKSGFLAETAFYLYFYSARMLSTGLRFAMLYTGRKVAMKDVTSAMPSMISQEYGPNTKMATCSPSETSLFSTPQMKKLVAKASTKHMREMTDD